MSSLLLALLCLALGKILQGVRQFPASSAEVLHAYVIYIALPALILVQVPTVPLSLQSLGPVLVAWLVMGMSAGITWLIVRRLGWPPPIAGALLLVITLGNTSFIGIPLVEAHLGVEAVPYAILYDQLGTFLGLNTLGIAIAHHYSHSAHLESGPLWSKILRFPPFGALLCGVVLIWVPLPAVVVDVLQRLAATLVPVVMVAVGLQWRLSIERSETTLIAFALIFILMIKPAFAWALVSLLRLDPLVAQTTVLESAMPAMISTSALASAYGLAPKLVSQIIGYSLMFSFLTVWGWTMVI